jgi:magnesium-transporting ATPase (P-type)
MQNAQTYGLTSALAAEMKAKFGDNSLTEQESESFWDKFKNNLGDPMIKILCAAFAINVIFAVLGKLGLIEGAPEWYESVGIAVAIAIATFVSTFSEFRNENAFQKLQEEASRIVCKVYRDGEVKEIPINDIVIDDAILLQTGDKIPADGVLLSGEIHTDQSVLNGEAKEARKLVMPDACVDQDEALDFLSAYKVFRGSVVVSGNAVMRVRTVGDESAYGRIAKELQDDERDTPLKVKPGDLANGISRFGYIGGVLIAVALLFQRIVIHNGFDAARISGSGDHRKAVGGNSTERAMLAFAAAEAADINVSVLRALPFDSANKYSAAQIEGAYKLTLIKGAPEKLLDLCKYYYDEGGKPAVLAAGLAIAEKIDELAKLDDAELKRLLPNVRVIARALPSDKSRLVRAARDLNLVVGMTGDGVNDSPALKAADMGFAMGGGTEVAKEAAEIIIMDDNFSSIDKAILYGRTIFNSIRKFIIFQLTINVAAVPVSFVSPLLGMENPLSITQILWINLVMDTLAALAFGGEPALRRFMTETPKRRDESIVSKYMRSSVLTGALLTFGLSMFFLTSDFAKGYFRVGEADEANKYLLTAYFAFFIFTAVFNAFNARTERLNLFDHIAQNKGFLRVTALIAVVQAALVYLGGVIFDCYGLEPAEWGFVLILAVTIIPVDMIRKAVFNQK